MTDQPGLPAHLWAAVFQNTREAVLIADAAGQIVDVNPAFTRITGYSRAEAIGQSTRLIQSDYQAAAFFRKFWKTLLADGCWQGEIWNRRKNGDIYSESLTVSSIRDKSGAIDYFIAIFYDIGFIKEHNDRFRHLAHHDVLTELPNRLALSLVLPRALARARRHGTLLVVGILDLDDFKPINDTYGHKAGDDLLRSLSQRITGSVRDSDFVARLGGDEFVVVLEGLVHETEMLACFERIHEACDAPYRLPDGTEAKVGISLGWTLFPDDDPNDADSPDLLLRNADMALYVAKADKVNRSSWHHRWGQTTELQVIATKPEPVEGYGPHSERLLRQAEDAIFLATERFVDVFYASLATHAEAAGVLATMGEAELQALKSSQAEHLQWLLAPELTETAHRARAIEIGRIHALIGMRPSMLVETIGLYQQMLTERIIAMPGRVADRAGLVHVLSIRMKVELQFQLDAIEHLQNEYRAWLLDCGRWLGSEPNWNVYIAKCLDAMTKLPGIAAAAWGRPDELSHGKVDHAAGQFEAYASALQRAGLATQVTLQDETTSESTVTRAWATRSVVVNPSYMDDRHHAQWREVAGAAGIRSSAAFPVMRRNEPVGVISVYGRFPAQFEGAFMRHLLEALTLMFNQAWLQFQRSPLLAESAAP